MLAALDIALSSTVSLNTGTNILAGIERQIQALGSASVPLRMLIPLLCILVITGIYMRQIFYHCSQSLAFKEIALGMTSDGTKADVTNDEDTKPSDTKPNDTKPNDAKSNDTTTDDAEKEDGTGDPELDKVMETAGYFYERLQDIFCSKLDAWQRSLGYCLLYDEAAAPLGMIIDCEPIYFNYAGRRWLIEFWKGQYDLATGCEIGVYSTSKPDINISGLFHGPLFESANDKDLLEMSLTLKKNGKKLFARKGTHWWLTGFKLGEFSEPSELTMDISITLKDKEMSNAFVEGLIDAGYYEDEITVKGNRVRLTFDEPRTLQPFTRTDWSDWIVQGKNALVCDKYQDITGKYASIPDKINAIKKEAPKIYNKIINLGKSRKLFDKYEKVKKYLR